MAMLTQEEFETRVAKIRPDIMIISEYQGWSKKVKCRCKKCGYEWELFADTILQGGGVCSKCNSIILSKQRRCTHEKFEEKLAQVNPTIEVVSEYEKSTLPIKCKCKLCGHIWKAEPGKLLQHRGCPMCRKGLNTSLMEQIVLNSFKFVIGEEQVLSRSRDVIGLELDIYVPEKKIAVEIGSWLYHKDTIDKDIEKQKRCAQSGISLITIYDAFNGQSFCKNNIWEYPQELSKKNNCRDIYDVVIRLFKYFHIDMNLTKHDWTAIIKKSASTTSRKTTEKFIDEMTEINPNIKIKGQYINSEQHIECECLICGYAWKARPANLLRGSGCLPCSIKRRAQKRTKTHDEFVKELNDINPDVEIIGLYTKSKNPILSRCKICNYEWKPKAGNLLKGLSHCPRCSYSKPISHESFLNKIHNKFPNIDILSIYTGSANTIDCKCKFCHYRWTKKAVEVTQHGCPNCHNQQ